MKELPQRERPYEKCLSMGPESLSDTELLAVLLRSGTPGENAVELANRLLYQEDMDFYSKTVISRSGLRLWHIL